MTDRDDRKSMRNMFGKKSPKSIGKNDMKKAEERELPNDYMKSLMVKMAVLGIIIIGGVSAYSYVATANIMSAVMIIGAAGFLPIGLVLGGLLINQQFRCRAMRAIFKKNFGVVHFVDGKDVHSKIKNFEKDIIETKKPNKLFYLRKGNIYNSKGDAVKKVDQDVVKFTSGIPMIFFDTNNMIPLTFHEKDTAIHAEQMAAIIKAHATVQETKLVGRAKAVAGISAIILLGMIAATIVLSYQNLSAVNEQVIPLLQQLKGQVGNTIIQGQGG